MIVVDGENETRYYYHFDGLGSVVALSNNDGDIVELYSYDVFGDPNRVSNVGNPYLFTGRRYDSEAGLYYYRARYYKPSIGRFIQTDPIRYTAGLNLYTYCWNNPVNWIDPWGLNVFGAVVSWIGGYGWNTSVDMGWKEAGQLGKGAAVAAGHGAAIAANEYTFGLIDPLDKYASEKVSEYGEAGEWSKRFAGISRDAAIAAAGAKGFEKFTGIRFELHGTHQGTGLPHIQAIKGLPGDYHGYTLWRWPPH